MYFNNSVGRNIAGTRRIFPYLMHIAMALVLAILLMPFAGSVAGAADTVEVKIWFQQDNPTEVLVDEIATSQIIYDVFFVNSTHGWICAEPGDETSNIYHTSDGGETWAAQNEGDDVKMRGVFFLDENVGWAVGSSQTILHTENGGQTWTTQAHSDTQGGWRYSVFFVDANHGWATGGGGTILHTTNGGATWDPQVSGVIENLQDCWFFDQNNGVVVGSDEVILTTDDGGATWTLIDSPIAEWNFSITCLDADTWWIGAGHGNVLYTENGGASFTVQQTPSAQRILSINFFDENNGVAGTNGPEILRTTNGGSTWTKDDIPAGGDTVRGLHYLDANTILAVGNQVFWKYMVIDAELPTADFSAPTAVTPNQEITFANLSTGYDTSLHPMTYEWDFGDEETSTLESPTHSYDRAGKYTVTLAATNLAGEDEMVKTDYIFVTAGGKYAVTPGTATTISGANGKVEIIYVEGAVTKRVEVEIALIPANIPKLPSGYTAGTSLYAIDMWDEDEDPVTTLAEPVIITVEYGAGDVAAATRGDVNLLTLAYYDEEYGQWVMLDTTVDTTDETLTAETAHLGVVAVLAKPAGGGGCGASAAVATSSEIALSFGLVGMLGAAGCYVSRRKRSA